MQLRELYHKERLHAPDSVTASNCQSYVATTHDILHVYIFQKIVYKYTTIQWSKKIFKSQTNTAFITHFKGYIKLTEKFVENDVPRVFVHELVRNAFGFHCITRNKLVINSRKNALMSNV